MSDTAFLLTAKEAAPEKKKKKTTNHSTYLKELRIVDQQSEWVLEQELEVARLSALKESAGIGEGVPEQE